MDNKSWRSISNMKQNDNTVNSHIPNCNSFSINENCVKQIQNTEPNPIYEQSSELKEKINELNSKISSLNEQLSDINLSNIYLKNLLRQKTEDTTNKRNNRNACCSPIPSSMLSATIEKKNIKKKEEGFQSLYHYSKSDLRCYNLSTTKRRKASSAKINRSKESKDTLISASSYCRISTVGNCREIEVLRNKNKQLEGLIIALESKLDKSNCLFQDILNKANEYKKLYKEQVNENKKKKEKIDLLNTEMEKIKMKSKKENDEANKEMCRMRRKIKEINEEDMKNKKKIEEMKNEIEIKNHFMDEMNQRECNSNKIIDELKKQIEVMTAMKVEVEAKVKIQNELEEKISLLEKENKNLQIQREVDSIENKKTYEESEKLKNENKTINKQIKELKEENAKNSKKKENEFREQISNLNNQIALTEKKYNDIIFSKDSIIRNFEEKSKELENLNNEIKNQKIQLEELKVSNEKIKKEKETIEKESQMREEEIEDLEKDYDYQIAMKEGEIDDLNKQLQDKDKEIKEKENTIKELNLKLLITENKTDNNDDIKIMKNNEEVSQLQQEIEAKEEIINSLQLENEKNLNKIETLTKENQILQIDLDSLHKENNSLTNEKKQLQYSIDSLKETIKKEHLYSTNEKIKEQKETIEQYAEIINKLTSENFELNNKVKHYMTHTKTKSESDDCSKEHNTTEEAKENELFELRIKNESLHAELKQKENELCELYQQNKKKDELINKNASLISQGLSEEDKELLERYNTKHQEDKTEIKMLREQIQILKEEL